MSNMKVMLFQKVMFLNNSTSNSVHEINYVYFVFLLLSKNTNLQWA